MSDDWPQTPKTSAVPPAVDDPVEGVTPPTLSTGSPTVPAGVSSADAAPPTGLSWPTWAVPAICDVLAGHSPFEHLRGKITCVGTDDHFVNFADWQDWREHVAPLIAERLDTAWRAKQSRGAMETGLDMGASIASEFFPQHRRPQK